MRKFLVLVLLLGLGAAGCNDKTTVDVNDCGCAKKVDKGSGPAPVPCPPGRVCDEPEKCRCGLKDCTDGKSLCKCKAVGCVCPK